jgi:hypothetical protein
MVTKTKPPGVFRHPWHAVSIIAGPEACPTTKGLSYKRFLSDGAPPLPAPGCSTPWRCKCTYLHHSDRRAGLRRLTDRGGSPNRKVGKEMREGPQARGRRVSDQGF